MRRITRAGLRGIGLLVATGTLCAAAVVPAAAAEQGTTWQADLASGEGAGIVVADGTARFDRATAHGAPPAEGAGGAETSGGAATDVVPTGLLTLPPRALDTPTSEIDAVLDARTPPGSTATVDVRGRRTDGAWTEWVPAATAAPGTPVTVRLPVASREVQGRLVLTSTGGPAPSVRGVRLTATPAPATEAEPSTEAAPRSFSVFATREGLVGGTTANGRKILPRDRFVALPSRRALSANGRSDYSVKVCAPNGRCAFAPVWDIGPWNTKDDYWNPSPERQMWKDLPMGRPQAAAAFENGHNGGRDQFGRRPSNPAGIDLGDGIFWDVLGLRNNSVVRVDYLWTGSRRLSAVAAEGRPDVEILAEPRPGAAVVGSAADTADVPVQCVQGSGPAAYVRIGERQYLPMSAFPAPPRDLPGCGPARPATTPADPDSAPGRPAAPTTGATGTAPAAATPAGTSQAGSGRTPKIPGSAQRAPSGR